MTQQEYTKPPIAQVLKARNLNPSWLAKRTGYTYLHVWRVVAGRKKASLPFRVACSLALNLPLGELFADDCELAIA